jgi:alpha-L-fucosidase
MRAILHSLGVASFLAYCRFSGDILAGTVESTQAAPPETSVQLNVAEPARRRASLRLLDESPELARGYVPALLEAMNDADSEVRWRAELALGRVGSLSAPAIAEGLKSRDPRIRRAAAYVLGPIGPRAQAAVPDLLRTGRDPESSVRVWSVMALGLIAPRNPSVLPVLAEALHDPDVDVLRVALRIVIKLGPDAKDLVPGLRGVLDHPDSELRWLACISFRQLGPAGGIAAPRLVQLLSDPDAEVRTRAAQALSRMGEAAIPAIRVASEGADPQLRAAAEQVLKETQSRSAPVAQASETNATLDPNAAARATWYNEAKFGLFIHWGLYSAAHRARPGQLAEWVMANEKIPPSNYEKFAPEFTATRFDPDAWVELAKETGARYLVLTSKHHEGFCLWDTPSTDYNAAKASRAGRDLVGALSAAAERGGIKLALYYSLLDWHNPDCEQNFSQYVSWMHGQLRELLTRYPIWGLWFDGEWTHSKAEWRGDEIVAMTRQLRPLAFVNDRIGRETRGVMPGVDFYTKEQEIPPDALRLQNRPVAWETCQTFGYSWGYNESPDPLRSGERLIEELVDVVSKGGNFLLNIGPRPDGTIPEYFQERMRIIGRFLKDNGEAIYGTERSPFRKPLSAGRVTAKGTRLYVFLDQLQEIELPGLRTPITRATVLKSGATLKVVKRGETSVVSAPAALVDPTFTVVAVDLGGRPEVR